MRVSIWTALAAACACAGCSKASKPPLDGAVEPASSAPSTATAVDVPTAAPVDSAPPVAPPSTRGSDLPPGFAKLSGATLVEVADEWNGLGNTHDVFIRLERKGARFTYRAKLSGMAGAVGERVPDPSTPTDQAACVCAVDDSCPCEYEKDPIRKSGAVPAAVVEGFLVEVARHGVDPDQKADRGTRWTDDYPKAHVAVWIPGQPEPIHLSFLDQRRRWRASGKFLDDSLPEPDQRIHHADINAKYRDMLRGIGLDAWKKGVRGRGRL